MTLLRAYVDDGGSFGETGRLDRPLTEFMSGHFSLAGANVSVVCGCPGCAEKIATGLSFMLHSATDETPGQSLDGVPALKDADDPLFLGDDIGDDTSSTTTIAVGGSLNSSIQHGGDLDYIRVSLVAGQTYAFSLAAGSLPDPYVELRTAAGVLVAENDDGGIGLNSYLMYRPTQSGDYFIVARGFNGALTGAYSLTVNTVQTGNSSPTVFTDNGLPQFSWQEAAIQITRSGASWAGSFGAPVTIAYAYRSSAPSTMPDDTGGFSRFSAAQIAATEAALAAWAAVANITFVRADDGSGYSNSAAILFANYSTGAEGAAAFAYLPSSGNTASASVEGDIWVNSTLSYNISPVIGEYGQHVLLHEIGHALGLSHPGDYNAAPGVEITYGTHAEYFNDSRMFTAMSYFASTNTGGNLPAFASLPQLHDIAAIQRLYGANLASRTGDTIYGFNSNTGLPQYAITLASQGAVFAIWDGGGLDTLDLSGYATNSIIDLREEAFSNAGPTPDAGPAVYNISIARGVVIENAVGGSGNDTITGNNQNNTLTGAAGNDTLNGGAGNDTLSGNAGNDVMSGGTGDDAYYVDSGDTIIENSGQGIDTVNAWNSLTLPANVENLILLGLTTHGTGNALDNTITGNNQNNTLTGAAGNDTLNGGAGNDTLSGGAGADVFVFSTAPGTGQVDTVADFTPADDTIWFDVAIFNAIGAGTLAVSAFHVGAAATDAAHRIVYDDTTGALYYDPDGAGGADQIQFATLTMGLALTNDDFFGFGP